MLSFRRAGELLIGAFPRDGVYWESERIHAKKERRQLRSLMRLFAQCVLLFVLIGCSSSSEPPRPITSQAPSSTLPSASPSAPLPTPSATAQGCPVTLPNGSVPPNQNPSPLFYGNGVLWTSLWSQGQVVFGPGGPGQVGTDGSLSIQWPWWRGTEGVLAIEGKRQDASAPPMKAIVPDGFGASGFQPTTLVFSSEGCWQVTGKVGESSLTFVTLVVKTK